MNKIIHFWITGVLCLFFPETGKATFKILSKDQRLRLGAIPESKKSNTFNNYNRNNSKHLRKLSEQNEKIIELMEKKSRKLFVSDHTNSVDLPTGTVLKGILLNNFVSSNLQSPILIKVHDPGGNLHESKLDCSGQAQGKRVFTNCKLLISKNYEYETEIQVLNFDGTAGLKGRVYSTKEATILGIIASEFITGMVDARATKLLRGDNAIEDSKNNRNFLLKGLSEASEKTGEFLGEGQSNPTEITYIRAGYPVLLYLKRRLKI